MHRDAAGRGIVAASAGPRRRPSGREGARHASYFRDRSEEAFAALSLRRCGLTLCVPRDGFVLTLTPASAPPTPGLCASPQHGPHGPRNYCGAPLSRVAKRSQPGRPGSCPPPWKASRAARAHRPVPAKGQRPSWAEPRPHLCRESSYITGGVAYSAHQMLFGQKVKSKNVFKKCGRCNSNYITY